MRRSGYGDGLKADVAPDAMVGMDHQFALREAADLLQEIGCLFSRRGSASDALAEYVLL